VGNALSSMLYLGAKQCLFVVLVGAIVMVVRDLLREDKTMANEKETTSKVNATTKRRKRNKHERRM
jgi:hypothetical protein